MKNSFTEIEKYELSRMLKEKRTITDIAKILGKSRMTIYSEMQRGADPSTGEYDPERSQDRDSRMKKQNKLDKPENIAVRDRMLELYIARGMVPAKIRETLKEEFGEGATIPCTKTIYNYISSRKSITAKGYVLKNGAILFPKEFRKACNIAPGMEMTASIEGEKLVIEAQVNTTQIFNS